MVRSRVCGAPQVPRGWRCVRAALLTACTLEQLSKTAEKNETENRIPQQGGGSTQ